MTWVPRVMRVPRAACLPVWHWPTSGPWPPSAKRWRPSNSAARMPFGDIRVRTRAAPLAARRQKHAGDGADQGDEANERLQHSVHCFEGEYRLHVATPCRSKAQLLSVYEAGCGGAPCSWGLLTVAPDLCMARWRAQCVYTGISQKKSPRSQKLFSAPRGLSGVVEFRGRGQSVSGRAASEILSSTSSPRC
jgi:hypothetical protein